MKIADFLALSDVVPELAAADKQKLLLELSRKAAARLGISADRIFAGLNSREELGSTGMGDGVAIPHARYHEINKPFAMFVRLKKPIAFDAVDGKPVDIVFLLLLPEAAAGEQLGALASIARKLRDPTDAAALRRARDTADIYRTLTAA
jgi:nitrogen PTS system EIIA component